jgi:hypothetical protein
MNRRPKIWTSEDQILMVIDRTKRMAERKLKKSQQLAGVAKTKFAKVEELNWQLMNAHDEKEKTRLQNNVSSAEISAGEAKEKADACAACYHRAINATLPRLGEILAAFRTGTFAEVMGDYKAVRIR